MTLNYVTYDVKFNWYDFTPLKSYLTGYAGIYAVRIWHCLPIRHIHAQDLSWGVWRSFMLRISHVVWRNAWSPSLVYALQQHGNYGITSWCKGSKATSLSPIRLTSLSETRATSHGSWTRSTRVCKSKSFSLFLSRVWLFYIQGSGLKVACACRNDCCVRVRRRVVKQYICSIKQFTNRERRVKSTVNTFECFHARQEMEADYSVYRPQCRLC